MGVTALFALSWNGAWWQTNLVASSQVEPAQVQHVLLSFELTGAISCSTYGWPSSHSPCQNFSTEMTGPLKDFYIAIGYALVVLTGIVAVATSLALLGAFGVVFGRLQIRLVLGVLLVAVIVGFGLLAASAVAGPGAQGSADCLALSGGITNCPFFWGSSPASVYPGGCPICYQSLLWGAGPSYYEILGGVGFGALAWWLLWQGRRGPYSRTELAVWSVQNRPYRLSGPSEAPATRTPGAPPQPGPGLVSAYVRPPPTPTVPPPGPAKVPWTCPECGQRNSAWAGQCGRCRTDRPKGA